MKKLYLALSITMVISTTIQGQEGWQIEVVSREGTKPELALDSQGRPHLTYMTEALVGAVYYASKGTDESWAIDEVSKGYFYAPMDIVVDAADNIHIAYHDHDFEDLAYAAKLDGQWSVETVSHRGHDGWDPALAIGPDGTVHIIAIDPLQFGTSDGIEYFSRRNDQWSVEGIGSGGILYEFGTGLAIDAEARLHAVYHNGMSDQFRETRGGGSHLRCPRKWHLEQGEGGYGRGRGKVRLAGIGQLRTSPHRLSGLEQPVGGASEIRPL